MANAGLVGNVREFPDGPHQELSENPRPRYTPHIRAVRDISPQPTRLIYFDKRRAAELLENIASTSPGHAMLANLTELDSTGILGRPNRRAIFYQILDSAVDLAVGVVIDLHQPDDANRQTSWTQLHPDQVVAIRGTVSAAKDIQPSSVRLAVDETSVRVFVERDHFLHLNQSYLTRQPITVIGEVRSVPRIEMCAAAIGILSASNGMR
jgi:hypothetical protein